MEMKWQTLLVWIHTLVTVIAEYYIHNETLTWANASEICQLAKPNILIKNDYETLNISTVMVTENTWVGYVAQPVVFKYKGCYKNLSQESVQPFTARVNVCLSTCDTSYVAIWFSSTDNHDDVITCLCINNISGLTQKKWSKCNQRCSNLACGSDMGDHMSVYAKVHVTDSSYPVPHEINPTCFTYDRIMSLESRECNNTSNIGGLMCPANDEVEGLCMTGENVWADIIKNKADKCKDSAVNCSTDIRNGRIVWSLSIGLWAFKTNQKQATVKDPKYVSFVDSTGKLQKTSNLAENYFALCDNTTEVTDVRTTTQTPSEIASASSHDISTTLSISATPTVMTDAQTTANNNGHDISTTLSISATPTVMTDAQTTANNNGLYVGLPVGIVLFLIIIVLLVYFRRRIYSLITKAQRNGDTSFNNVIYDNSIELQPNRDVASTSLSTSPEQSNYYRTVLDPVQTVVTTKQLNKPFTNGADDEAPRDIPQQNNLYDVADCPSQPIDQHIYDHTDINEGHNTTTTLTENYDSFPMVDDDNTYDVHSSGQRSQNHKDRSDNIYNTPCNLMSDGIIYDHTGGANARGVADENMYGHVSSDVTDNDGEDTYNHI